jgi:hypothetical protein
MGILQLHRPSLLFRFPYNWLCQSQIQSQSYFTTGDLPPISSSWRQSPWDARPDIFFFQMNTFGNAPYVTSCLTRGWVCHLQLLLVFVSTVILRPESSGTHDHNLLSQIRDSTNLEGQVPIFISPRNPSRTRFPFHLLLASQCYGGGNWPPLHTKSLLGNRCWPTLYRLSRDRIGNIVSNNPSCCVSCPLSRNVFNDSCLATYISCSSLVPSFSHHVTLCIRWFRHIPKLISYILPQGWNVYIVKAISPAVVSSRWTWPCTTGWVFSFVRYLRLCCIDCWDDLELDDDSMRFAC